MNNQYMTNYSVSYEIEIVQISQFVDPADDCTYYEIVGHQINGTRLPMKMRAPISIFNGTSISFPCVKWLTLKADENFNVNVVSVQPF